MLEFSTINWAAYAIAVIVSMGIGGFWYSPYGFGKQWSKYTGVDMMKLPKDVANQAIAATAVSSVIQMLVLSAILNALMPVSVGAGIGIGLLIWFGFVAVTTIGDALYSQRGWGYWAIGASYFFVVYLINSAIITAMLNRPA